MSLATFETRRILHDVFQMHVVSALRRCGFAIDDRTYHRYSTDGVQERLRRMANPTALFLRGRSDFAAVHQWLDIAFNVEAKTTRSIAFVKVEAVHLLTHIVLWNHRRVECLYAIYDRNTQKHFGFWVHDMPPIREIVVPSRWHWTWQAYYDAIFRQELPQVTVRLYDGAPACGSGTPYAVLDCIHCDHWYYLVEERCRNAEGLRYEDG